MFDVAIIPREKFSMIDICLSSVQGLDLQGGQLLLFDAGYPNSILQALRERQSNPTIHIVGDGSYRLANECLNMLQHAGEAPWILLLENDCEIIEADISRAIAQAELEGFSVVQPQILEADGRTVHYDPPLSFISDTPHGLVHRVVRNPRSGFPALTGRRRIFHVEKHALLIRRVILEEQVPFEDFLVTRSHWDLSFRLNRSRHSIVMDPSLKIRFIGEGMNATDRDYFYWRWDREKAIVSNDYIQKKWSILQYCSSVDWLDEMLSSKLAGSKAEDVDPTA